MGGGEYSPKFPTVPLRHCCTTFEHYLLLVIELEIQAYQQHTISPVSAFLFLKAPF